MPGTEERVRSWSTQALLIVIAALMSSMIAMGWARFDRTDANISRVETKLEDVVSGASQFRENVRERLSKLETIHERENR